MSDYSDLIETVLTLIDNGMTQTEIGAKYGKHRLTIGRWLTRYAAEHNTTIIETTPDRITHTIKEQVASLQEVADITLNANALRNYVVTGVKSVIEDQRKAGIDPHPGYYKILSDEAKELTKLNPPVVERSVELDMVQIPEFVKPKPLLVEVEE